MINENIIFDHPINPHVKRGKTYFNFVRLKSATGECLEASGNSCGKTHSHSWLIVKTNRLPKCDSLRLPDVSTYCGKRIIFF